ncbi:MAG: hypothetical protein ACO274_04895 [Vulcanococcus sp.]|jgi:type II secretory pathway component PulF
MKKVPDAAEKQAALDAFREEMAHEVEEGIDHHEQSMTRMGFLFLGIFVAVIAIAALLP